MRFDDDTLDVLDRQHGAISRRQLVALGSGGAQIDAMLRHGHLRRVGHGVYLRTGAGYGQVQRATVAMLRCHDGARITGLLLLRVRRM